MLMISLLLLTVYMAKEIRSAEDQAEGSGDEVSHPLEALICSATSPMAVPQAHRGGVGDLLATYDLPAHGSHHILCHHR